MITKSQSFLPSFPPHYLLDLKGKRAAVYGAGTMARQVIAALRESGVKIQYVIDAKTKESTLEGIQIYSPDDPIIALETKKSTPLFLGIYNPSVPIHTLKARLASLGWGQIIPFVDLHGSDPNKFGDLFWLTKRDFYQHHRAQIEATANLWSDDESRQLYLDTLLFRTTGDDRGLRNPDLEHQYFPPNLPVFGSPDRPLRMIDCGACFGDVLRWIRLNNIPIAAGAFFEPDPENFKKLVLEIRQPGINDIALFPIPCGVSDKFRQLRFSMNQGTSSALSEHGDQIVNCVSIDETLGGFSPNFIKMDIEGAEIEALEGARLTINTHRPRLAISGYHRPSDIWTIPQKIKEICPKYDRFYLRQHGYQGFDSVIYSFVSE
jgi:FkbM family methyltransferase